MGLAFKRTSGTVIALLISTLMMPLLAAALQSTSPSTLSQIAGFSENVLLSTDDSAYPHHVEVSMAISDNGTIFVGWKNSMTHNGAGIRVSVVKSVDGGASWTNPYNMPMFTSGTTGQSDPWMNWHDGSIYYTYLEYSISGPPLTQITVARSSDYGASWTPVTASYGDQFADKQTVAISDDGIIYMAYDDVDDATWLGNTKIRLTRSVDGGSTFQEVANITELSPWHAAPYVTLDSQGHLYVAWLYIEPESMEWGNLYLARSLDQGLTFEERQFINNDGNHSTFSQGKLTLPVIRFDQNDRLFVLWADGYEQGPGTFDVYLRYSDDYGETWSERFRVNPTVEGNQWNPEMDIDADGQLHIVYYDEQDGSYRPSYRRASFSGDEGDMLTFSDPIDVADAVTSNSFTRPGEYLSVQLDENGTPHVVWSDGRNNELDIYYAHGVASLPNPIDYVSIAMPIAGALIVVLAVILVCRRRR
jgi:flagellar hook protein FlgE